MNKSIIYKMDKLDTITSDPNNNNRGIPLQPPIDSMNKSYSLRPRSSIRSHGDLTDDDVILTDWRPRGRTKRRPKQKPPPLSKYRRKTANARERSRMREINEAFDTLRRAIPHLANDNSHSEKLTKITTLRLAMKYIAALNQVLKDPEPESDLDSGDYTLSLTPTSLSDHSDLYDQFLNASSTTSSNSCPFGSPSDDRQHITKFELSSLDDRQHLTKFELSSSDDRQHLTKFDLSSSDDRQHLSKFDLGSSDDRQHLTKFELSSSASLLPSSPYSPFEATSASMLDLRQHCLTPTDDFEADLDSFVTSAVDFEELFAS